MMAQAISAAYYALQSPTTYKPKSTAMKKLVLAIITITGLTIYSCNKTGDSPAPILSIAGTWHYIGYSGGFAGLSFQPADTIDAYIQADTATMRILASYNGQQACTNFTFFQSIIGCFGPPTYAFTGNVTLSNTIPISQGTQYAIAITHDTLILQQPTCADCPTMYYVQSSKHFNWCADEPVSK